MICNPSVIVCILSTTFGLRDPTQFQEEASDEKNRLAKIITDLITKSSRKECDIDEDFYLYDDFDGDDEDEGESDETAETQDEPMPGLSTVPTLQESESGSLSSEEAVQSSASSYQPSPRKSAPMRIDEHYTLDQMKTIIAFVDKRGTAAALKRRTSLGSALRITRMRAFLESGGHRLSKLDQLKNIVYTHFRDARDRYLPFHGHDLKGWSFKAARIVNLASFKASASFLRSLKTQFEIQLFSR